LEIRVVSVNHVASKNPKLFMVGTLNGCIYYGNLDSENMNHHVLLIVDIRIKLPSLNEDETITANSLTFVPSV
jgi:hypothetical protein